MPESELEIVLDDFAQSSKTRMGAGGAGLGLANCKEFMEQHGGKMWLESKPDGDTKFTLDLHRSYFAIEKKAA